MTGSSLWHKLTFRRPSSSTSLSDSSINSSTSSFTSRSKKRKDLFYEFDYSFESDTMNTHVQEPPTDSQVSNKNTGFREPLSHDRNTTLPHPDADTSQNACLESSEMDMYRTHSRLSFHRHHSKRKATTTLAVPSYSDIQYDVETDEGNSMKTIEKDIEKRDDLVEPPKTVEEFIEMEDQDGQGYKHEDRKKGLLRKLTLHKG